MDFSPPTPKPPNISRTGSAKPCRSPDGLPFLAVFASRNSKGAVRYFFEPAELDRFAAAHVDLKDLATERSVLPKPLRKTLSDAGVEPILPRTRLNKLAYRRADL